LLRWSLGEGGHVSQNYLMFFSSTTAWQASLDVSYYVYIFKSDLEEHRYVG